MRLAYAYANALRSCLLRNFFVTIAMKQKYEKKAKRSKTNETSSRNTNQFWWSLVVAQRSAEIITIIFNLPLHSITLDLNILCLDNVSIMQHFP